MTEITFLKTRHVYDSYMDFWSLVSLSNFPTMYVDEWRPMMDGVFITCPMNGDFREHTKNYIDKPRGSHIILWCLERPSGSAGSVGNYAAANRELIYQRFVDEVWVSDRRLADETNLRFVPLGSHEGLGSPGDAKRYDFCHMSYITPRRTGIYKHFPEGSIGPNCWPPQRDEVLRSSRFALNVHQDQHPFQEPLRLALFAAYGLPVLSETIFDSFPWGEETMVTAGWDELVRVMRHMLTTDYGPWQEMGLRARERMCGEFEFGKLVRLAVQESVERWR